MSEARKNKLAAQMIKAEMMNDTETLSKIKSEYDLLTTKLTTELKPTKNYDNKSLSLAPPAQAKDRPGGRQDNSNRVHRDNRGLFQGTSDGRVKKFIESTTSLSQMFVQEKSLSASDEARMFVKTAAKFSKDDMDTKNFSEEVDDSQLILNKPKRRMYGPTREAATANLSTDSELPFDCVEDPCNWCPDMEADFIRPDDSPHVFIPMSDKAPYLSTMRNVIIRSDYHACNSFVSSSKHYQNETKKEIAHIKEVWHPKGYRCIIMETYFKDRRGSGREFLSCGKHFQVHCLPIKEKNLEKARMRFKHALEASEGEWSMNRKLIETNGRQIQMCLPKGLSYFWVCFDELDNGFGHVIESEREFSRFFGLEVLCDLLDKESNPMEWFKQKFPRNRSRNAKTSGSCGPSSSKSRKY